MESKDQKDQISNDQFGEAENTSNQIDSSTGNTEEPANVETENASQEETTPLGGAQDAEKLEETSTEAVEDSTDSAETEEEESTSDLDLEEDEESDDSEDEHDDEEPAERGKPVDYSTKTKEELSILLSELINNKPTNKIRSDVESIRINFYKKHKADNERKRKEWIDSGGNPEEFILPTDSIELEIKELLKLYREKKASFNRELEEQKVRNLEAKQHIIEKIKDLVNRTESVNQTFQEFRDLQQQWREIGVVPQANLDDLWETYHHHVQNFYDYVKINKELKDLDLKKNLEEKISLCEKAEELLLEPSIINAFNKLQKLHNQWREIGPTPNENRTEIWERFKEVTSKINRKHQEHFENLREEQKSNLEAKRALCESAEEINTKVIATAKEWNKYSKEMIELQKVWKTIGFAPKKDNNKIYERFRAACDVFFNNKREFYKEVRKEQANNLQLRIDLCVQAEGLMESTDWKSTTEELIKLQKRWKEIGPAPRKHSDEVWKRFRDACDHFFERKSHHFEGVDSKYEDNLKAKEQLIEEINNLQAGNDAEQNLKNLKEFQRRWAEIGFVPLRKKDELQKRYREAINKKFEDLNIDSAHKHLLKFKTKIDAIQSNPRGENKIRTERDKLFSQLKQLEGNIVLWENNIGFFAKSKKADQLIKDVERKIEKAKEEIRMIEEKIRLIDSMD